MKASYIFALIIATACFTSSVVCQSGLPLEANITAYKSEIRVTDPLSLSASTSADSEDVDKKMSFTTLNYTWTCKTSAGGDCLKLDGSPLTNLSNSSNLFLDPLTFAPNQVLVFNVKVTKDVRSAEKSITIAVAALPNYQGLKKDFKAPNVKESPVDALYIYRDTANLLLLIDEAQTPNKKFRCDSDSDCWGHGNCTSGACICDETFVLDDCSLSLEDFNTQTEFRAEIIKNLAYIVNETRNGQDLVDSLSLVEKLTKDETFGYGVANETITFVYFAGKTIEHLANRTNNVTVVLPDIFKLLSHAFDDLSQFNCTDDSVVTARYRDAVEMIDITIQVALKANSTENVTKFQTRNFKIVAVPVVTAQIAGDQTYNDIPELSSFGFKSSNLKTEAANTIITYIKINGINGGPGYSLPAGEILEFKDASSKQTYYSSKSFSQFKDEIQNTCTASQQTEQTAVTN